MAKTVISTFGDRSSAERAVSALRDRGFDKDISIVAKDDRNERNNRNRDNSDNNSIMTGVSSGGAVGGLLGLAAGAGALVIPGIGPLLAAGPIAGALTGAATGGIAGGLIDFGIPSDRGRYYEDRIKQGNALVTVNCDDSKAEEASELLRQNGGSDVEIH